MPRDPRTYITLNDGMPDNGKIRPLTDKAFRTIVEVWCWCSRERSDGLIPAPMFNTFGTLKARKELIAAGLIETVGDQYQAHDYLEHQRSRDEIDELSRKRAEAGAKGGKTTANAKANAQASAAAKAKQTGSKVQAETETDHSSSKNEGATRGSRILNTFSITPEMRAWSSENTPLVDIDGKLGEFIDYWTGVPGDKGVKLDWVATWRNGMRKQQTFAEKDRPAEATAPKRKFVAYEDDMEAYRARNA